MNPERMDRYRLVCHDRRTLLTNIQQLSIVPITAMLTRMHTPVGYSALLPNIRKAFATSSTAPPYWPNSQVWAGPHEPDSFTPLQHATVTSSRPASPSHCPLDPTVSFRCTASMRSSLNTPITRRFIFSNRRCAWLRLIGIEQEAHFSTIFLHLVSFVTRFLKRQSHRAYPWQLTLP